MLPVNLQIQLRTCVKYTVQKSINVDDIEGHVIRIFKTETS